MCSTKFRQHLQSGQYKGQAVPTKHIIQRSGSTCKVYYTVHRSSSAYNVASSKVRQYLQSVLYQKVRQYL